MDKGKGMPWEKQKTFQGKKIKVIPLEKKMFIPPEVVPRMDHFLQIIFLYIMNKIFSD